MKNLKKNFIRPLKACSKFCSDCMGGKKKYVAECITPRCPLYDLRTGHNLSDNSTLKLISMYCSHCCANIDNDDLDKWRETGIMPKFKKNRECENESCPLYPYRHGHNPNRKGAGNKSAMKNLPKSKP